MGHRYSLVAVVAFATACAPAISTSTAASKVTALLAPGTPGPRGCFDPADYGAIPSDKADDRAPAQQALDNAAIAGGTVCFGPGRWTLSRAPVGSYDRFAALSTHGASIAIRGSGPGTILDLVGDQGGGDTNVIALDPGASNITIDDLTIDTSGATNTSEQTHAIAVGSGVCPAAVACGPVQDVRIERVYFNHPSLKGFRKGDCVHLLGNATTPVKRVTLVGNFFTVCARSGVGIQRDVFDLKIVANQFTNPSDQDIDAEPTGTGTNDGLEIVANTFDDDRATSQGDFSVSVTGIDAYEHVAIAANNFKGRGLWLYRVRDLAVTGNVFEHVATTAYGVIEAENVAERVLIASNVAHRTGVDGPMIRSIDHSGGSATGISIRGNALYNETGGNGIQLESATNISISDNDLTWAKPAIGATAIMIRATTKAADGVLISGNHITAPQLNVGVRLSASPFSIGSVSVVANMALGPTVGGGLRCEVTAPGVFASSVVASGNSWLVAPSCSATLAPQRP